MRRLTCLFLALLLLVSMAACGGSATPASPAPDAKSAPTEEKSETVETAIFADLLRPVPVSLRKPFSPEAVAARLKFRMRRIFRQIGIDQQRLVGIAMEVSAVLLPERIELALRQD